MLIEYWKLTKAFRFTASRVDPSQGGGLFGLPLQVTWQLSESYSQDKTREHDAVAVSHLLYVVVPLVAGYSVYSLLNVAVSG